MISAVVLSKNEEKNITLCLESLKWCNEIIVVDDYSEDKTIESVKRQAESVKKEIKLYQRKLNGDFAAQRNFGLEQATGNWVLFVDADEIISEALAFEIKTQISNIKYRNQNSKIKTFTLSGFYIKRNDYFLGRWLKYGETGNIKLVRLAKKEAGLWVGEIHEKWHIKGKLAKLNNPIIHNPHPTISSFLQKINLYTDIIASEWQKEGKRINVWEILLFPLGKFLQNYLLRLGLLDGLPGFIMAMMMSFHSFLARGKLWMLNLK